MPDDDAALAEADEILLNDDNASVEETTPLEDDTDANEDSATEGSDKIIYEGTPHFGKDTSVDDDKDVAVVDEDNDTPDDDVALIACATEAETRSIACGYNDRGYKKQECTNGYWTDIEECDDPDECYDGWCFDPMSYGACFWCVDGHWVNSQEVVCTCIIMTCQDRCNYVRGIDCGSCHSGYFCDEEHYCRKIP
ncbi:MAG TPA: hypothetical protein PLV42_05715 [bacterium]|nr:hypothetical protein [bacterium]